MPDRLLHQNTSPESAGGLSVRGSRIAGFLPAETNRSAPGVYEDTTESHFMTDRTERLPRNRSLVVLSAPAGRLPATDCVAAEAPFRGQDVAVIQADTGRDGRDRTSDGPSMWMAAAAEILEPAVGEIHHAGLIRAGNMAYRSVGNLTNEFAQTLDMVA